MAATKKKTTRGPRCRKPAPLAAEWWRNDLSPDHLESAMPGVASEFLRWMERGHFSPKDGLRLIDEAVLRATPAEWDFSGMEPSQHHHCLLHEYGREMSQCYAEAADFYREVAGLPRRNENRPEAFSFLDQREIQFPIPWRMLHDKSEVFWGGNGPLCEEVRTVPKGMSDLARARPETAICLLNAFRASMTKIERRWDLEMTQPLISGRSFSCHRLILDWSKGKKALEVDVVNWFRSLPRHSRSNVRGRSRAAIEATALAQLSAWRARRAGLKHADYTNLLGGKKIEAADGALIKYNDTTAYHRAAKSAESRILRMRKQLAGN